MTDIRLKVLTFLLNVILCSDKRLPPCRLNCVFYRLKTFFVRPNKFWLYICTAVIKIVLTTKTSIFFQLKMINFIHPTKAIVSARTFPKLFVTLNVLVWALFFGSSSFGQTPVTYTSNGTWTCPAGVTSVTVECWGAGGGGGGRTSNGGGAGGGGGAYAKSSVTVIPGNSYAIAVGVGGAGSSGASGASSTAKNGGNSSFAVSQVVAQGGFGVASNTITAGNGGSTASSTGQIKHAGGNGSAGGNTNGNNGGAGGGGAGRTDHGNGIDHGGLYAGNGGGTQTSSNSNGNSGSTYGGGGGGAKRTGSNRTGGAGANGLVVITFNDAIWQNPIIATNPNNSNPYAEGNIVGNNITVSGITRGPGLTSQTADNRYNTSGFSTSGSLNTGDNDYFEFTLTPGSAYMLNLNRFSFIGEKVSTAGPYRFSLRSSVDNYAADIEYIVNETSSSFGHTVNLSAQAFQGITSSVSFRLYGWYSASSSGTFSVNEFAFYGATQTIQPPTMAAFYPTNACPNSEESIVIPGTNFYGVTSVKFNGTEASFVVNSPTQITATLPSGASTGFISVTAAGGTVSSSNQFIVYASGLETVFSANFNDNNLAGWTQTPSNTWAASNTNAIGTPRSLYTASDNWSIFGSNNVITSIVTPLSELSSLDGKNTTWRFNSKINTQGGGFITYSNEAFIVLASNSADLSSASLNGYAVRIYYNASIFSTTQTITLCKITNGIVSNITSSYSFAHNDQLIGYEISRNSSGLWELKTDNNGGFDALVSRGTASDNQHIIASHLGAKANLYSSGFFGSVSTEIRLDDFEITQTFCEKVYYSQANGNSGNAVWNRERSGGTPEAVTDSKTNSFVIQSNHTIAPNSSSWTAKNITIETGGILDFTSSGNNYPLSVYGEINNQGTLTSNDEIISFVGETNQSISSNTKLVLNDLIINNGHNLTLPSNVDTEIKPRGVITLPNGNLITNNHLILSSRPTGTGSIGTIANGHSVTGEVTLERYLPNITGTPLVGNGGWIAVGTPIIGATVAQWDATVVTTGFPGSNFPPPGYTFNNIQWYNESVAGNLNNGYTGVTGINDVLQHNRGYFFYTYANLPAPQNMLRAKGTIQQGSFNDPLSYTSSGNPNDDGWNLLVNRYPSEIDFAAISSGSGISSYYLYDTETNNYKVYPVAQSIAGTAPRYIASGQGYFVKATAPGLSLHYTESAKTNNGIAFERDLNESSFISLKFRRAANSEDECVLNFSNNATASYEYEYDAVKLHSQQPTAAECAFVSEDGKLLTIDSRPAGLEETISIPIYVEMPVNGTFRLIVNQINNLPFGSCLFIEDLVTGNTIPVIEGQELVVSNTGNYSGNRFVLHATPSIATIETNLDCFGSANGSVELTLPQGEWSLAMADTLGNSFNATEGTSVFENLPAGQYIVSATNALSNCPSSQKTINISEPADMVLNHLNSFVDNCNSSSNGSIEWAVSNATNYEYSVTNEANEIVSSGIGGSGAIMISDLAADIYTVTINNYCGSQNFETNLIDTNVVSVEILSENISMALHEGTSQTMTIEQSNQNATNFTWTLSNGYTSSSDTFNYEFLESGDYVLTLFAHNNQCSSADSISIFIDRAVSISEEIKKTPISFLQTKESLEMYLNLSSSDMTMVTVYDISGRVVWNLTTSTWSGKNISIGTGSFASGVYVVKTTVGDKEILNKKFINP